MRIGSSLRSVRSSKLSLRHTSNVRMTEDLSMESMPSLTQRLRSLAPTSTFQDNKAGMMNEKLMIWMIKRAMC